MILLFAALAIPAVAGTALILSGRGSRPLSGGNANMLSLVASLATAAFVLAAVIARPVVDQQWLPSLGIRLQFAVDGISAPLLILTAALSVAVVVHAGSRPSHGGSPATFYGCLQLVELGALATFFARDAIIFYVSFEIVLIPMWVLISRYGDSRDLVARADASGRFVLFTVLGSTLMLIGILALVQASGTASLDALAASRGAGLERHTQIIIAALLLVGLSIKIPVFPLHTWLPPAHTIAPTAGSVMLAAVLLKMGTYGVVRLVIAPLPIGFGALAPAFAILGVAGIIWGGLACLVENDLKRLIAYSSVAHMGFVVLGLSSGTTVGLQAALFANIAHGNNSIVATRFALTRAPWVVTECGFGSDLGLEKFMHIKARAAGLQPACVVLVCTVRALKVHAGVARVAVGKPLDQIVSVPDVEAVERGAANLRHHLRITRSFGVKVVVALNHFPSDSPDEVAVVERIAREAGAGFAVHSGFADGGDGATELARAVVALCGWR